MQSQVAAVDMLIRGHAEPRFEALRERFEGLFEQGRELGASLAVTLDGEPVLDLWGGYTDETRQQPWQADTITAVWSITKTMTSLAALKLVDLGQLDPDRPVAHYWPEFAAAGKRDVLVRHVLAHGSGLAGWDQPVSLLGLCDWAACCERLAAQAPWWTPGTASGYHVWTYGFLVGELIRRISGLRTAPFFAHELARPLQADFQIGVAPAQQRRVAPLTPPPLAPIDLRALPPDSPAFKCMTNPVPDASVSAHPDWRAADIGSGNGFSNARAVARLQTLVACGGESAGLRLLSEATVRRVFETQTRGVDLVLGAPLSMGLGYGLSTPATFPFIPPGRIALWGGWGGSIVLADADRRLCMSYVMNRMAGAALGGPNAAELVAALYAALESGR